ncbi:DUF998 domain-containing protein [Gordonia sp. MP11Mi]|uniref:DUF998 domain-containing protein n=1 Tax=Gordonia sp. MP11Mi TaxID=3022769 RepID=A0AA97CSN5_9ACTN
MIITTLAVASVALCVARLLLFAALHAVPSPYNAVEHAVSDYAVGPTRRLSAAMTTVTAASWLTLAGAAYGRLDGWPERTQIVVLLVILAAIFVALPFAPTDVEGQPVTPIGRLHYVLAIAWFAISYSLTGDLSQWMNDAVGGPLAATGRVLHWVALGSLIALIVALIAPKLRRRYFGTAERVFLVAISTFFLIAAIALAVA